MSLPPDDERTVLTSGAGSDSGSNPGFGGAQAAPARAAGANALPVGTRLGEFEITGLLGEGGFGIVYLAYDNSLERKVALKEYMPAAFAARGADVQVSVKSGQHADTFQAGLRSFVNEARILAQFDHPALIKVYRFWEANGTAYMVMPYYQGQTLKQALLARAAPPDEAWLRALLAPLLDTLALIHDQQCFHRDIAPDNILMLGDCHPLLLDFGAARRAIGGIEQAFTVILKQSYAPIEQYGDTPGMRQGAWTDLFALASVIHFAIDGQPPPPAVGRVLSDPYVPLAARHVPRYSPGFLAAIDRALSVRPEDRPQTAAEMRALLGLPEGVATAPLPAASAASAAPRRRPVAGAAIAVAVLAAAALGFILIKPKALTPATAAPGSTSPPAAPGTAAPPPLSATAPFDPIGAQKRILDGASPDRMVTVQPVQARVKIGRDLLRFSVRASHAGYLYVQMVGTNRGEYALIFPNALDKDNRVEAGQTIMLPRSTWKMGVDGPAGIDHFVAIVSDSPRQFRGAGLQDGDLFATFPIERAGKLQHSYTGPTPLFAGLPDCADPAVCPETYGASMFSIEELPAAPPSNE
jgi:hypothetical protein